MEGKEKDTGEVNCSYRTGETTSLSSSFCSNFRYQWVMQPPLPPSLPPSPLLFPSHLSWFSHPPLWWRSVISYHLPSFAMSRTRPRAPHKAPAHFFTWFKHATASRVHIRILCLPRFNLYMVYKRDSFHVIELNSCIFGCHVKCAHSGGAWCDTLSPQQQSQWHGWMTQSAARFSLIAAGKYWCLGRCVTRFSWLASALPWSLYEKIWADL